MTSACWWFSFEEASAVPVRQNTCPSALCLKNSTMYYITPPLQKVQGRVPPWMCISKYFDLPFCVFMLICSCWELLRAICTRGKCTYLHYISELGEKIDSTLNWNAVEKLVQSWIGLIYRDQHTWQPSSRGLLFWNYLVGGGSKEICSEHSL